MTTAVLRCAQAGAILTALGLSAGLMTGVAAADPPREHKCISPIFPGSNLNERYGVSERIVGPPPSVPPAPPSPGCLEAFAGEHWVRAVPPWVTADTDTDGNNIPDAIDDFKAKFAGARYVTDEGTAQEKTVTVGPEILRTTCLSAGPPPASFQCKTPNGLTPPLNGKPFIALVSPVFNPLPVGTHTSTLYVTMKAATAGNVCNGLVPPTNSPGLKTNCLPAGPDPGVESPWPIMDSQPFTVKSQPPPSPGG